MGDCAWLEEEEWKAHIREGSRDCEDDDGMSLVVRLVRGKEAIVLYGDVCVE